MISLIINNTFLLKIDKIDLYKTINYDVFILFSWASTKPLTACKTQINSYNYKQFGKRNLKINTNSHRGNWRLWEKPFGFFKFPVAWFVLSVGQFIGWCEIPVPTAYDVAVQVSVFQVTAFERINLTFEIGQSFLKTKRKTINARSAKRDEDKTQYVSRASPTQPNVRYGIRHLRRCPICVWRVQPTRCADRWTWSWPRRVGYGLTVHQPTGNNTRRARVVIRRDRQRRTLTYDNRTRYVFFFCSSTTDNNRWRRYTPIDVVVVVVVVVIIARGKHRQPGIIALLVTLFLCVGGGGKLFVPPSCIPSSE